MNLLSQSKFSTKLLTSFVICALITLAVGGLGMVGISRLATALSLTFTNSLVSVGNINETMTSLVAHNRGLYRLLDAHAGDLSEADKTRVRQNLATDLARAEDAFATYRATPLAIDERAAGDKYKEQWPGYVAGAQKVIESVDVGDLSSFKGELNPV